MTGGTRSTSDGRRRAGRSLSTRVLLAVVATLLVAALVGSAAISATDSSSSSSTTQPVTLKGNARELFDLLAKKDDATYHARYDGTSPDVEDLSLETWQEPPNVRQDSNLTVKGQKAQTSSFVLDDTSTRCVRIAGAASWTCQPGAAGDADPLAAIRARLGELDVTARDTTLAGRTVRCFGFTTEGTTNELCLTPDHGIPVLVRAGGSELNLTVLDTEIPNDTFLPPAAVAVG